MTLLTFSNLYAEEFSLHNIAVIRLDNYLGPKWWKPPEGELRFWRSRGRKLRGRNPNFHLQAGGTNPSRHYAWSRYAQIQGKVHFVEKGQFSHDMRWIWDLTHPLMLKFSLEIHFEVIQNHTSAILEILNFHDFSGVKVKNLVKMAKIWTLTHWIIAKNQNLKNHCRTILQSLKMYLQTKLQHQQIFRFLDP